MSEDPDGFAGGYNLYRYVGNSPTNGTDRQGTWAEPNGGGYYNLGDSAPSRQAILTGGANVTPAVPKRIAERPWFAQAKISDIRPLYTSEEATLNYWREGYNAVGWGVLLLPGGPGEAGVFAAGGFAGTPLNTGHGPIGASASPVGRSGRQARLRALASDPNMSSADRGWIQQEINSIERGQRTNIRAPFGKSLAHRRGFEAKRGFGYEYSDLQDIYLHRLQHKHEGY